MVAPISSELASPPPRGPSVGLRRAWERGASAAVDYGLVVAAVAVSLLAAAAAALNVPLKPATVGLVFTGSLGVYLVDRLVDRRADRGAHPRRAARFHRHARRLTLLAAALVLSAIALGLLHPWPVRLLMAGVVVLAAGHLRLKGRGWFKPLYIVLSWLAVTVGIPSLMGSGIGSVGLADEGQVLAVVGLALFADVLACDAADREAEARGERRRRIWNLARLAATSGLLLALSNAGAAGSLWPVPALVLLSLLPYRPHEDWTAGVVDVALGLGALVALIA